ncbi:putative transporter YgaY-like protein [Cladobotryum mycophilum]|uniref:Transporter YgaY-like protein n=1 Tax=Cladobotryum mycophilum TaxID=491253 RepID=A0ABR0SN94_9HYPO
MAAAKSTPAVAEQPIPPSSPPPPPQPLPPPPQKDPQAGQGTLARTLSTVFWTPPWLRWNHDVPYELTWSLNILFACVAAFGAANMYYTHPILHILADDFGVSDERASLVPTMVQAGYAAGLLFICPVGDLLPRRPLIIFLSFITAMVWLGCTITKSFEAFMGLHFIVGAFNVTPQLMFPLAVRYAPLRHRPTMTAITLSGILFGILVARLLAGIITEYASWRIVYWVSFGLQMVLLLLIFLFVPNFPVLHPGVSYPRILLKIATMPFRYPVLVQQSLIAFLVMAMFTSFWTTLTFQLSDRFHLSTLVIGLFALVGLSPVVLNPVVSRFVMSRIHPSGTLILGHVLLIGVICIGTFVGNFSIAGTVIWACLGDLGMNIVVVSNRMSFAHVEPTAQNAVNSVYMVFSFCGQLFGTALGNSLYADGGWIRAGVFSIGIVGGSLLLVLLRGPHEKGWIGWRGGWELRTGKLKKEEEEEAAPRHSDEETAVPEISSREEKVSEKA